jgi:hypothetical protein
MSAFEQLQDALIKIATTTDDYIGFADKGETLSTTLAAIEVFRLANSYTGIDGIIIKNEDLYSIDETVKALKVLITAKPDNISLLEFIRGDIPIFNEYNDEINKFKCFSATYESFIKQVK